ncbi:hypothetical protein ND926_24190 [Vibrio diabolicus]|nr:hypothetical protein [Vibrio alginolyticus]MCS0340561.1 hypothetical protein [Vibrio diabolicus]
MFKLPIEITLKNGETHQATRSTQATTCSDKSACF